MRIKLCSYTHVPTLNTRCAAVDPGIISRHPHLRHRLAPGCQTAYDVKPASFLATFNIRDWPRETPDILLWLSSSLERVIAPSATASSYPYSRLRRGRLPPSVLHTTFLDEMDHFAIRMLTVGDVARTMPDDQLALVLADVDLVAAVGQSARRCSASIENDNDALPPTPHVAYDEHTPIFRCCLPPPLTNPTSCCSRASCADSGSWEISRAVLVAMTSLVHMRAPRVPAPRWDSQLIADGFCESARSSTGDDDALPSRTHATLPNRWRPARGCSEETLMESWVERHLRLTMRYLRVGNCLYELGCVCVRMRRAGILAEDRTREILHFEGSDIDLMKYKILKRPGDLSMHPGSTERDGHTRVPESLPTEAKVKGTSESRPGGEGEDELGVEGAISSEGGRAGEGGR
ncbi:hypothetical protein GGF50DRAFT_90665 [Schizophyllum commune]